MVTKYTVSIQTIQWESVPHLENTEPFDEVDAECLNKIGEILLKYGLNKKFGIHLIHKHFDVDKNEAIVEYPDPESRELHSRVVPISELKNSVQTMWSFEAGPEKLCQRVCRQWCDSKPGTTAPHVPHHNSSHGGCF